MKKALSLLFVIQISSVSVVLSQASDACPSWNKTPIADKADYFSYLSKKPKKQETTDFSTPRYYNFNAAEQQKNKPSRTSASKSTRTGTATPGIIYGKQEPAAATPELLPAEAPKKAIVKRAEPVTTVAEKKEIVKVPSAQFGDNEITPQVKEAGKQKEHIAVSKKEEKRAASKKEERKFARKQWVKKFSFRKKNAAKCPDF